jgi:hypothetical protein
MLLNVVGREAYDFLRIPFFKKPFLYLRQPITLRKLVLYVSDYLFLEAYDFCSLRIFCDGCTSF